MRKICLITAFLMLFAFVPAISLAATVQPVNNLTLQTNTYYLQDNTHIICTIDTNEAVYEVTIQYGNKSYGPYMKNEQKVYIKNVQAGTYKIKARNVSEDEKGNLIYSDYISKEIKLLTKEEYEKGKTSSYTATNGKIAQACQNEKKTTTGGKAGDQTKHEVQINSYSYSSRSGKHNHWTFVARCKDPAKAELIAQTATAAANNNCIGYCQTKSHVLKYHSLLKAANWNAAKIKTNCETCCCPFACAAINAAYKGQTINPNTRSYQLKSRIKATDKFIIYTSSQYTAKKTNLKRGDILCSGHHTAVVL